MNIFKAAYCRTYQLGFRVAMPFLPYREPEPLDSVRAIPKKLKELGVASALVVTDKSLRKLGMAAPIEEEMSRQGLACHIYDETVANPTVSNVEDALRMYKAGGCGALIGLGGGAAMDCAKAVGARVARPDWSVQRIGGNLKLRRKIPPLIAVPTTAGTGSEATVAAVIVDDQTRHKFIINDFNLIPRYAVLDPKLTEGLPPFFTATTGVDAMTHAVEAYIGQSTTKQTRAWSVEAVRLIFANLERAYRDGHDMEARANMLRASYLAGLSFTRSYVGYCHAVAHSLGGKYNIPHGLANAVLLPVTLRAYGDSVYGKLKELAVAAGMTDADTPSAVAAEIFIRAVEELERKLSIPSKFPEIRVEDIPEMARYADKEGNPLYPVPRLMDESALRLFYVTAAEDLRTKEAHRAEEVRKHA